MTDLKSQEVSYGERIGSGGSDAILSSYFRDILLNLHIDSARFQNLLDRHIVRLNIASNTAEISTARSALRRELMSQTMTWKVFIKGLMFLKIQSITIELTLHRDDSKITLQSFHIPSLQASILMEDNEESGNINVLARFYRDILTDLNMNDTMFEEYLDYYVKFSKPGSSPQEQHAAKCSLKREILKDSISWKVFVKGLIFLKTNRFVFGLKMIHANGAVSKHKKTLVFK